MQNLQKVNKTEFKHLGWTFEFNKSIISASQEIDALQEKLKLQKIPDVVFGKNVFRIISPEKQTIFEVNAHDSLQYCNFEYLEQNYQENNQKEQLIDNLNYINIKPSTILVKLSEVWKHKNTDDIPDVKVIEQKSDHFFCTPYKGTIKLESSKIQLTDTNIPLENLTEKNPIIFAEHLHLWEDELGDNGCSQQDFRFRVMKDCFFGLIRFYIRVDEVTVRVYDTRFYHEFGQKYIIREFTVKESSYDEIKAKGFKFSSEWLNSGPNQSYQISEHLQQVLNVKEKIFIS